MIRLQPRPAFELVSPYPFLTTITITPLAPSLSLSLSLSLSFSLSLSIYIYIYVWCRSKERIKIYIRRRSTKRFVFFKFIYFVLTYVLYMCMFPACLEMPMGRRQWIAQPTTKPTPQNKIYYGTQLKRITIFRHPYKKRKYPNHLRYLPQTNRHPTIPPLQKPPKLYKIHSL